MKWIITAFILMMASIVFAQTSTNPYSFNLVDEETFLGLDDTPSSYSGEGDNCVRVNVGETALTFGSCGGGGAGGGNTTTEIQNAVGTGAGGGSGGFGEGLSYSAPWFNHSDTSNQSSSDNSGTIVIQDILLDSFGHLTSITTINFWETILNGTLFLSSEYQRHDQDLNTTDNVVFSNLTVTNNLSVGGDDLFVDGNLGRVGIGTSSPARILHIKPTGGGTDGIRITESDSDNSAIQALALAGGGQFILYSGGLNDIVLSALGVSVFNERGFGGHDFRIEGDTDDHLFFLDAGEDAIGIGYTTTELVSTSGILLIDGSVGIGTTTPTRDLNVVGDANITGTLYGGGQGLSNISLLDDDLVLNMPFDTNTLDYSGEKNDGTKKGNVFFNATGGYNGFGAYEFDGNGDYIDLGDVIDLSQNFTVTAWVNVRGTQGSFRTIVSKYIGTSGLDGFEMYANNANDFEFFVRDGATVASPSSTTSVALNTWQHITGVYDGTEVLIYVNGVEENSEAFTSVLTGNSNNFYIGARDNSGSVELPFNGTIDEVMVFNRTLTSQEIKRLFESRRISQSTVMEELNVTGNVVAGNISALDWTNITITTAQISNFTNLNSSGILRNYNATGLIQNYNASGLLRNWQQFLNQTGILKNYNASGGLVNYTEVTDHRTEANDTANSNWDIKGNQSVSTDGSTSQNPKLMGFTDLSVGEAVILKLGDLANGIQNGHGNAIQTFAFHTIIFRGDRGITTGLNLSNESSMGVLIDSTQTGSVALGIQGASGQSADLVNYRNSGGSILGGVDNNGTLIVGGPGGGGGGHVLEFQSPSEGNVLGFDVSSSNYIKSGGTATDNYALTYCTNGGLQYVDLAGACPL